AYVASTYMRFRLSTAGGLAPTGAATDGEVEDYKVTINPTPVVGAPVVNADYAQVAGASDAAGVITFYTDGTHGFTLGNTVFVQGYIGAASGYNGQYTITGTPTASTFTVTGVGGLPNVGLPTGAPANGNGYAVSLNTAAAG